MKKYIITTDCINFIRLSDLILAKRLANEIQGGVFLSCNNEMVLVYNHTDQQ